MSTTHYGRRAGIQHAFIRLPKTYFDFDFLKKLSMAKDTRFLKNYFIDFAKNG